MCRTLAPGTCPPSQQPLDATGSAVVTVGVPGFTLSGTVSDARRNGQGLAGVTVRLENGQQQSTTTDRNGRYRFLNVSGTVMVTAGGEPSYRAETVAVTVSADHTIDFSLNHTGIPPYRGTVFITPDILGPEDPTSLQDVTYVGRGERVIYDRRPNAWITVSAFLFSVRYEGAELEFQVNPEFGNREAARRQVDTYAAALGRLPAVFLSRAQRCRSMTAMSCSGATGTTGASSSTQAKVGSTSATASWRRHSSMKGRTSRWMEIMPTPPGGWQHKSRMASSSRRMPATIQTEKTLPRASCRISLCGTVLTD